ncbi:MAG TPA: family 43 glycosylhydrolase [Candidatus Baltobacteraceae bacterium]|nr:family 43 glycosylhydrolase [Candidatus Baltobacteraceae bacterium]
MRDIKGLYTNPVYRGDFPDPSVIRVGENDFWATTTSTDWAPQFPLLHSRDLVNWTHASAVFGNRPEWSAGNFWAPELSYYRGRFYVYYVARHRDGPLTIGVATAEKAEGPYTDHGPMIGQAAGSIDPTAVTGEDDRRYLIWKEDGNSQGLPTTIWIQPLSEDGLRLVESARPILSNDAAWEGGVVEAPSIMRRDGYFYLFYSGNACCGRNCKYAVGVARAASVLGPWEKYSGNPILKGNGDWRCPGHGSVVDTAQGQTYYLYHAYAKRDSIFVGRQTLLDKVTWRDDGWPQINEGKGPSSLASAPLRKQRVHRKPAYFNPFIVHKLIGDWQWPQGHPPQVRFPRGLNRGLILGSAATSREGDALGGVLARCTHYGDYTAETAVDIAGLQPGVEAGLCAYGDAKNSVGISYLDGMVRVWQRTRGEHRLLAQERVGAVRTLRLRMSARRGYQFSFSYNTSGTHWTELRRAPLRAAHLPPWDRGIRIALTVGGCVLAQARFKWLRIIANQAEQHSRVA